MRSQVESAALNEASHTDSCPHGKKDGPVFHTRGLTLSEEHRCGGKTVIVTYAPDASLAAAEDMILPRWCYGPATNAARSVAWQPQ